MQTTNADYERIEKAIVFLAENYHNQPRLDEAARAAHLSEFHFQRLFRRWAGISPKRFVQFLTLEHAKLALVASRSVLDAAYSSGLSGSSRLHDLFVNTEAMTPGEFKAKGAGLTIRYGFHPSPFGECLIAATERGICGLGFVGESGRATALDDFKQRWPAALFQEDAAKTRPYIARIFHPQPQDAAPLKLLLIGTRFQIKVWEALLRIPSGAVVCYEDLARRVGKPSASRAVGGAVGRNPISFLIPCHRAIRKMGITGDYHWGAARKKAILAWEAAREESRS
jgi:AraC family transcriptional regulator of adaptative response/methylated-DNA-[protein]-cysteine methyltransferase